MHCKTTDKENQLTVEAFLDKVKRENSSSIDLSLIGILSSQYDEDERFPTAVYAKLFKAGYLQAQEDEFQKQTLMLFTGGTA